MNKRLLSLDTMRGLIMVLMALDHANYFIARQHSNGEYWGGPFPTYVDGFSFITRLVTHLCAPGFCFLMGIGMVLFVQARLRDGWSLAHIRRHFWLRGLVLIGIDLLLVSRAWESPGQWSGTISIGVLFALGVSMLIGSLLLGLKPAYLLGISVAGVLATEWYVAAAGSWGAPLSLPQVLLLVAGGPVDLTPGMRAWSLYPALPWLPYVVFGMVFGYWLGENPPRAFERAWKLGLAFLAIFIVLRLVGGFGNLRSFRLHNWIDFMNVVKYPPSLTFGTLTLGIDLILLWMMSRLNGAGERLIQPLVVFGRTPLFFYMLHLYLYELLGLLLSANGTSLLIMYPYWLLGLLVLYPLCLLFGRYKSRQPAGSLVRLF